MYFKACSAITVKDCIMVHEESVHNRRMMPRQIHRSFVNDCLSFSYPYSYKTAEIGRNLASLQIKLDLKTCECHFCFNERIQARGRKN